MYQRSVEDHTPVYNVVWKESWDVRGLLQNQSTFFGKNEFSEFLIPRRFFSKNLTKRSSEGVETFREDRADIIE